METIELRLLDYLIEKTGIASMSESRLRQHCLALAQQLKVNFEKLMFLLLKKAGRDDIKTIFALSFWEQMQDTFRQNGIKPPKWRYGPGGNHILFRVGIRDEGFVGNNICECGGKAFAIPRQAAKHVARLLTQKKDAAKRPGRGRKR